MLRHDWLAAVLIQIVIRFTGTTAGASTHWCTVPDDTWVHADISPGHADLLSGCQDACRTTHNCTFYTVSETPSHGGDTGCFCLRDVSELLTEGAKCDGKSCCGNELSGVHTVCDSGTYGITCGNDCPPMCVTRLCDVISGECLIGCEDGWHDAKCERECGNCVSSTCNQSSGVCDDGCDHGWYSPTCTEPCSIHCSETSCSRDNGTCHGGCKPGWYKLACTDTCPENCVTDVCAVPDGACEQCLGGWFGPLCDRKCPQQCEDLCDMLSGNCIEDWQYLGEEYWSDQWDCPDNCLEGRCDNYTKACDSCNDGFWGELCDENCPVNCNASVCDIDNGECTDGCEIGWDGIECDQDIDECAGPIDGDSPCGNKHCYNTPGSYLCCSEGLVSRPTDTYMCYDSSPPVWIWPVLVVCLLAGCVAGFFGHRLYVSKRVTLPWQKKPEEPIAMPMPLPDDIRHSTPVPETKLKTYDDDEMDYEDTRDTVQPDPNKGRPLPQPGNHGNDYINRDVVTFIRETSKTEDEEEEVEYESVQNVERPPKGRYSAIERRLQNLEKKAYINE